MKITDAGEPGKVVCTASSNARSVAIKTKGMHKKKLLQTRGSRDEKEISETRGLRPPQCSLGPRLLLSQNGLSQNGYGRAFQDVESICSAKLSHVPSQPTVVSSPRGMLNVDQSLRPDTWNILGTSGNVFDSPRAPFDSSSTPCTGMLHSWNLNATDGDPVRPSTGKPAAGSEEHKRDTKPTPRFARKPSTRNSLFPAEGGCPQELHVHG